MPKKLRIRRKIKLWETKRGTLYLSKDEKRIIWNALQEYSFQETINTNKKGINSILTKLDFVAFSGK